MPVPSLPVPAVAPGNVLTSTNWNAIVKDSINKLLNQQHRKLTVAQFGALTGIEEGDEAYLEVDATNGCEWHLVHRTAEPTYKWRKIGGPPLIAEVLTNETTASTAYADLATVGPAIALPRAGDYPITVGAQLVGVAGGMYMAPSGAGITASDNDAAWANGGGGGSSGAAVARTRTKTGLTTATVTAKFRVTAGTATIGMRWMSIDANRIRHDA